MSDPGADDQAERRERERTYDEIMSAFDGVEVPSSPFVDEDDYLAVAVQRRLVGRTWDKLSRADLTAVRLDLGVLDPSAFWYFFPAFARAVLINNYFVDGMGEFLVAELAPGDQKPDWSARLQPLSSLQRRAVANFLRWYISSETYVPARDRLADAWGLDAEG